MDKIIFTPELLCILAGFVAAVVYVFSGYHDPGNSRSLADNPRIQSLLYVLGGGFLITNADWKSLSTTPDKTFLTIVYLECALVGIAVLLVVITTIMFIHILVRNKGLASRERINPIPVILSFLQSGFGAYFKALEDAEAKATPKRLIAPQPVAQMIKSIYSLLIAEELAKAANSPAVQASVLDKAMDSIVRCAAMLLPTGQGMNLQANYMSLIEVQNNSLPSGISKMAFYDNDVTGCSHVLSLKKYNDNGIHENFVLPVHSNEKARLFGAPDAVIQRKCIAIKVSEMNFGSRPDIPSRVVEKIGAYLKTRTYKSFLSIPVSKDHDVIGVINIESEDEVFSSDNPEIADISTCLLLHSKVVAYN